MTNGSVLSLDAENVPFVLRDTSGRKPRLWLYVLGLRRNHEIDFEDGKGLAITTYPHNNDGYRIVCVFADELGRSVDPRALEAAFDEFLHPPKLVPRIGIAAVYRYRKQATAASRSRRADDGARSGLALGEISNAVSWSPRVKRR